MVRGLYSRHSLRKTFPFVYPFNCLMSAAGAALHGAEPSIYVTSGCKEYRKYPAMKVDICDDIWIDTAGKRLSKCLEDDQIFLGDLLLHGTDEQNLGLGLGVQFCQPFALYKVACYVVPLCNKLLVMLSAEVTCQRR